MNPLSPREVHDLPSKLRGMQKDVVEGLSAAQKSIPSKYFYDERGSRLFDQITRLDEYYLTRAEALLMMEHAGEMAEKVGPRALLIEYGSGSSAKTRALLDALESPAGYVPIDISVDYLLEVSSELQTEYPDIPVLPVAADFTGEFDVPSPPEAERRRVAYFPGSTIGNFTKTEAVGLLTGMAELCRPGGGALVGVDTEKSPVMLEEAYNDPAGVTAEFNLNLLRRMNRELEANFDIGAFHHRACYNGDESRIEMYLVSDRRQRVKVAGQEFEFENSELILTEYSHKYTLESFGELAAQAGLELVETWTDPDELFNVHYLEPS